MIQHLSYYDNLTHKYNIYVDIDSWVATSSQTFLIYKIPGTVRTKGNINQILRSDDRD